MPSVMDRAVARAPFHPAWLVAGAAFVTLLASAGFRSLPAVLLVPLEEDLGWSRGSIAFAAALGLLFFGLVGPFVAALMGRFGIARVVAGSLVLVAAGSAASVLVTREWHLVVLWGLVVGVGTGGMATVLAATVASRWFVARRGLVTGALTAATALGQLVFLPWLARLAALWGWRTVSLAVAGVALAVLPIVLLLRDRPEELGVSAYGAPPGHPPTAAVTRPIAAAFQGLHDVVGTRAFWLLAATFWVCGASTNGLIGTHFIAASTDHGMPETSGAVLLAVIGAFNVVGALASGWLTDRVDPRLLLLAYYGLRGLSLLTLHQALGAGSVALWVFVVFYGLDWIATVPPTVALSNELFGRTVGPIVFGWVFAAHQVGAASAAWTAGLIRTWTGSYHWAFVASGVLCLFAAIGILGVQRPTGTVEESPRPEPAPSPAEVARLRGLV